MKPCPFCAEQIQDSAIVCRFCGSTLPDLKTHGDGNIHVLSLQGADDDFETDIVGELSYQDALREVDRRVKPDLKGCRFFTARLQPEPDNPDDHWAVAVLDAATGATLGYLARDLAIRYHEAVADLVAKGQSADVPAQLRGGRGDKWCYGVILELTAFSRRVGVSEPKSRQAAFDEKWEREGRRRMVDQERLHDAGCVEGIHWRELHRSGVEARRQKDDMKAVKLLAQGFEGWCGERALTGGEAPWLVVVEYVRLCRRLGDERTERAILQRVAKHGFGRSKIGTELHQRLIELTTEPT